MCLCENHSGVTPDEATSIHRTSLSDDQAHCRLMSQHLIEFRTVCLHLDAQERHRLVDFPGEACCSSNKTGLFHNLAPRGEIVKDLSPS